MIETLHLVPHEDVPLWLKLGWVNLGLAPAHHGVYSCVLLWPFEREAEIP